MSVSASTIPPSPVPASLLEFDRRVYAREFRGLLGWGETWFRRQIEAGRIPVGHRDVGNGRRWWTATEVRDTLARLNAADSEAA